MLIHSTAVGYSASLYHSIYHGALLYNGKLEMGKNTNLGFAFSSGSLVTRVRFFRVLSTFKQLGSCSVRVL